MDRRSIALGIVALLVIANLGLLGGVAYPLSHEEPRHATAPFDQGLGDSYRLTAAIATDGTDEVAVRGTVDSSGERYSRTVTGDVVGESYSPPSADVRYRRLLLDEADADGRIETIESTPDETLHRVNRTGDRVEVVSVIEGSESETGGTLRGGGSVVTSNLGIAAYERVGTTADGHLRLHPRSGWYEADRPYRIEDASGTVVVEDDSNVVRAADVEWTLTTGAESYLHYHLASDRVRQSISYEVERGSVDVRTPEWVESLDDEA